MQTTRVLEHYIAGEWQHRSRDRWGEDVNPSDATQILAHVPLSDPANGDTCPGNARPPASNARASRDQAAYLGDGCHRLRV